MSNLTHRAAVLSDRWLLLLHQLPAKPAYQRVKLWRRLQTLGAVAVKNAVYALPASEQSQEDFEWLLKEVREGGGEAVLCEARFIDGMGDEEVRGLFNAARETEFGEVAAEARERLAAIETDSEARADVAARLPRMRARLEEIAAIDFFGANGREAAEGLLNGLEKALAAESADAPGAVSGPAGIAELRNRCWVTRQGVYVDRIACAWLIRRFIDPGVRFKFVPPRGYEPEPGELRFDMYAAEITHEGDRCSFEVLLERAGLDEPGLKAIAEIVHDIDLKDGKFGREETAGLKTLIAGLAIATSDDEERIARGGALFDDLYVYFRKKRG